MSGGIEGLEPGRILSLPTGEGQALKSVRWRLIGDALSDISLRLKAHGDWAHLPMLGATGRRYGTDGLTDASIG